MDLEWRKSKKSCHYFLSKYAYIQNRNTGKTVKWIEWEYLADLIDLLNIEKDLVFFKARQIGWSWLLAGFGLWKVMFSESAKGLYISQGENEAWDMIGKSKFILTNLPSYLQLTQRHADNRSLLDFTANNSLITALPSTKDAGRSTDATFVFRDELKAHPYGRENFVSVSPCIDSGGQIVDLSTIDKADTTNHFTERINKAMAGASRKVLPSGLIVFRGGESGAILVFGGWRLRPVREEGLSLEEWYDLRIKHRYTDFDREQEYPETVEDALKPAQTKAFFDISATESMLLDIIEPLRINKEIDTSNGMIKIYKLPQVGRKYCIFTDPSDGVDDPFHTVVLDAKTWEGVSEAEGKIPAEDCAAIHDRLVRFYNNAYNTWEANAQAGGKFTNTIKDLDTPNQAPRRDFNNDSVIKDKMGWWTSEPAKRTILYGLKEAIFKRLIVCHNKTSILQFQRMFVPEGGTPQVPKGMHDDAVITWAGVWQLRRYAPIGDMKITSWRA